MLRSKARTFQHTSLTGNGSMLCLISLATVLSWIPFPWSDEGDAYARQAFSVDLLL